MGTTAPPIGTQTVPKKVSLRDSVVELLTQRYPNDCPSDAVQQLLTRLATLEEVLKISPQLPPRSPQSLINGSSAEN
ncbi:MAG: hypothetical protein ABG776_00025 [Cyanobacteria bacterium J06555_13]